MNRPYQPTTQWLRSAFVAAAVTITIAIGVGIDTLAYRYGPESAQTVQAAHASRPAAVERIGSRIS